MKEIRNGISMKISHQINLFFEYMMAKRLIAKIEKNLELLNNKKGSIWEKRKIIEEQSKYKWLDRKEKILEEWNSINDYSIESFPYVKKEEILKYYESPKRKTDRNPFMDLYK